MAIKKKAPAKKPNAPAKAPAKKPAAKKVAFGGNGRKKVPKRG